MKTYLLERIYKDKNITLGRFWFEGEVVYTMELPDKNNQKYISCIPEGVYNVEKTESLKFKKKLWLVKNVPNRSGIRIHSCSFVKQLEGCIAPGLLKEDIDKDGILDMKNSRKAMSLLNDSLPNKFKLEIIWNILIK